MDVCDGRYVRSWLGESVWPLPSSSAPSPRPSPPRGEGVSFIVDEGFSLLFRGCGRSDGFGGVCLSVEGAGGLKPASTFAAPPPGWVRIGGCGGCFGWCFFGGAVAQLGERVNGIDEVRGSNPLSSTRLDKIKNLCLEVQAGGLDRGMQDTLNRLCAVVEIRAALAESLATFGAAGWQLAVRAFGRRA